MDDVGLEISQVADLGRGEAIDTGRAARDRLAAMLNELWSASGLRYNQASKLGIDKSFHRWRGGSAPSSKHTETFWTVLDSLHQVAGRDFSEKSEWRAALRAAQEEADRQRDRQLGRFWAQSTDHRFVQLHGPGFDTAAAEPQERKHERKAMDAFVLGQSSEAASYLCWYADAPVGKTTLLADYVRQPPVGVDILNFFVSPSHGTDTREAFEAEMIAQIGELTRSPPLSNPRGVREWKALFTRAADASVNRKRHLVLVVDGLDDDVAWSGRAAEGAALEGVNGSIAALLPGAPPPGMRVVVSLRRRLRFPDDLSTRHPLRSGKSLSLRELRQLEGALPAHRLLPSVDLSEPVTGMLAVAGGGLRAADLAELTGIPLADLDQRLEGQSGRSFILDDPVLQTYALADPSIIESVRTPSDEAELARYKHELLDWSRAWRKAGWPAGTPPFAVMHQLRLLTDPSERVDYVLDTARLRQLAAEQGPDVALAQLGSLETEARRAEETSPKSLAVFVRLAATRAVLNGEPRDVPFGAPALHVRSGEVERARALARSAPTADAQSMHLADVAVEMAHARRVGAGAVAQEAADRLAQSNAGYPGIHRDPATHVRLLGAARALIDLDRPDAARPLLRAVIGDPVAEVETLAEAAGALAEIRDPEIEEALHARADALSAGSTSARAAAVDLWGALGHFVPSLSTTAGNRIELICDELDRSDGLAAVDVLALSASALSQLRHKRPKKALRLVAEARTRIRAALTDPESLTAEDRAHLGRELSGTLTRLALAIHDVDPRLDVTEELLDSLPVDLRVGLLGDDIRRRAATVAETAVARKKQAAQDRAAAAKERKDEERREKDAERRRLSAGRKATEAERRGRTIAQSALKAETEQQESRSKRTLKHLDVTRHRPAAGLAFAVDDPFPERLQLLQEADTRLSAGDVLRGRGALDQALRLSPALRARPSFPPTWTVHLAQALGTAGEFDLAERLTESTPERALHLAALSLGCSLGSHPVEALHYAHEAARLAVAGTDPTIPDKVARALAWAGEGPAATGRPTHSRETLTAIAAGLVRHRPEESADIAEALAEKLARRSAAGSVFRVLPELAALLLAYPDIRRPGPRLTAALLEASYRLREPNTPLHPTSMAVVALLAHLGLLSQEATDAVAATATRWRTSLRPGQDPIGELTVLYALEGGPAAVSNHEKAASAPSARATVHLTAAAYYSGAPVALTVDKRAEDRVTRICLALAHACHDDGPPSEAEARTHIKKLLEANEWAHTIPLSPRLFPEALPPLIALTRDALSPRVQWPGIRDDRWMGYRSRIPTGQAALRGKRYTNLA
ncbi:hypothetical protein EDD29_1974 [Actinocorallia herbida]|uniref:Uncharacterized protein n=1 Tax=Actinocorallia herbida TaxID=58109 RepID=A0A3N1CT28_9ACTN|nr:hypothetical protein [Actinocorallia herbida]ROO84450.1 hypothetical protein EDD29_1974 [Actinocorallia herbida]